MEIKKTEYLTVQSNYSDYKHADMLTMFILSAVSLVLNAQPGNLFSGQKNQMNSYM